MATHSGRYRCNSARHRTVSREVGIGAEACDDMTVLGAGDGAGSTKIEPVAGNPLHRDASDASGHDRAKLYARAAEAKFHNAVEND